MRRRGFAVLLLAVLIASTACGTVVFDHTIEVQIADPSRRLGSAPVEVSVFDNQMGQSAQWAGKTMGVAAAGAPYVGRLSHTGARMIFDSSLPDRVIASIAIPAYEPGGYFVLQLAPPSPGEKTVAAPFVPFGSSFNDGAVRIAPLPLRVQSEPGARGWMVRVTIDVPPRLE